MILAKGIPTSEDGAGYVVIRAGKSIASPHRLSSTREYYVRRGERSARMTAREIKDLTLDLAHTGTRVQELFEERRASTKELFERLLKVRRPEPKAIAAPLVIRVTPPRATSS